MSESLYETDFYAWARQQAQALRDRAGPNALDIDNLAEEVDDLARRDRDACESQIENILEHLLMIQMIGSSAAPHWAAEIFAFRMALNRKMSPTLRKQLPTEFESIYAHMTPRLKRRWPLEGHVGPASRIPQHCPYDWDDIMGRGRDWTPEPFPDYPA